ncbi:MAG: shikimate kinase [Planctomycetota bacterium]|nr:shikimate kinase [Planctomycetota bacterium]
MTGGKAALIGMMASGKSTVGARLAEMTGIAFLDADADLEARAGMSVPECFAKLGEAGFRRLERETLRENLSRPDPLVIALGGGAYMQEEIRRDLRAGAFSIYLRLSPAEIVARLEGSDIAARPMLSSAPDWRCRARELTAAREPVYLEADLVIEAGGLTVDGLAGKIAAALAARGEFRMFFQAEAPRIET